MKRALVLFLALVMVMCCVGCGASNSSAEAEAMATKTSPADIYLAMAQDLLTQEKYDSAIDVLNQAKAEIEDPRLEAMIVEIEAARPVYLKLDYTVNTDNLETQGVQIHEVTAQILDNIVRYDIAYTAPAEMYLQVAGTNLNDRQDYLTPRGEHVFAFETNAEYAMANLATMTIRFCCNAENYMEVTVATHWPDFISPTVEVPVTNGSKDACGIALVTVTAVDENLLHYHVEINTPEDESYNLSVAVDEESPFIYSDLMPGHNKMGFLLDRETVTSAKQIRLDLMQWGGQNNRIQAKLLPENYTLPQALKDSAVEESCDYGMEANEIIQISNVSVCKYPIGNLYSADSNASSNIMVSSFCNLKDAPYVYFMSTAVRDGEPQNFFFPSNILNQVMGEHIYIQYYHDSGYIEVEVPLDELPKLTVITPEDA